MRAVAVLTRIGGLLAVFAAVMVTAPAAGATKPVIDRPGKSEVSFRIPAGAFCEFPLRVVLQMRRQQITFVDKDGNPTRTKITGVEKAQVTNLENDRTLRLNISGPGFYDGEGLLLRGTGRWSGIMNLEGVAISTSGNITFNADGLVTSVHGHEEAFCPPLA